jgi:predicted ATPase/tetratricopeptide (TPR) repeat protein
VADYDRDRQQPWKEVEEIGERGLSEEVIRTPDQRLRVFVSSTLAELADERREVAGAISTLGLTPVMFELGARPYPPRDVYRAYLAQSDVFIGLYWQGYGRVGPGMEISALEEEFELSRDLPRLLYVKTPAPGREPRLEDLVSRLRQETSYRKFETPADLGTLVRNDLATLLSERFAAGPHPAADRASASATLPRRRRPLPVSTTPLLGREQAIDQVARLVELPDVRWVTLTGPGGVGKTRLAVAAGERLRKRFGAGTVFVSLADVAESGPVLAAIGHAVEADLRTGSPLAAVVERLGDDPWLLILDNLEQALDAARDLDELLARCPEVAILATSRMALRLRAEREYPVPPLPVPADPAAGSIDELASSPAVALFVDRARAVRHDFSLTHGNAAAVAEICRRLEGVPLAIELAAARTRLLDPDALLRRLATSLDALGTGAADMPERQRTLRATVEWSVGLLDDAERRLLETAAVFVDGWTVEAAATVAGLDEDRTLSLSEGLARHSLIGLDTTDDRPRSRMLDTVRAFVAERLDARPDVDAVRQRHADYYRVLAENADRPLRGVDHNEGLQRLEAEAGNLAAAIRWYLEHDTEPLPHLFRVLWVFWELRDRMAEGHAWVEQLLPTADSFAPQARAELLWASNVTANEVGDDAAALAASQRLAPLLAEIEDPYLHAICQLVMGWTAPIVDDFDGALVRNHRALDELRGQDEPYWTAIAALTAAGLEIAVGRYDDAAPHLHEARDLANRFDYSWAAAWSRVLLGYLALVEGRLEEARALLEEGLALSRAAHSTRNLTLCLVAFARLALVAGDPERAGLLAGAAEGLRRRVGMRPWPMLRRGEAELVAEIREALGADRLEQVFTAGAQLNQRDALAAVREGHGAGAAA